MDWTAVEMKNSSLLKWDIINPLIIKEFIRGVLMEKSSSFIKD